MEKTETKLHSLSVFRKLTLEEYFETEGGRILPISPGPLIPAIIEWLRKDKK